MLQQLSDDSIFRETERTKLQLADLDAEIARLTRARDKEAVRVVEIYLPELNSKVLSRLRVYHSDFLTDSREKLFIANKSVLGMWKPKGYQAALALLQAQFKAYLNTRSHFATDDARLRRLMVSRSNLAQQLTELERESKARLDAQYAAVAERNRLDCLERDNAVGLTEAGDQLATYVVQHFLSPTDTEPRQDCTPAVAERQEIATDDRLGCFS